MEVAVSVSHNRVNKQPDRANSYPGHRLKFADGAWILLLRSQISVELNKHQGWDYPLANLEHPHSAMTVPIWRDRIRTRGVVTITNLVPR
jgi:hypothetical protein